MCGGASAAEYGGESVVIGFGGGAFVDSRGGGVGGFAVGEGG